MPMSVFGLGWGGKRRRAYGADAAFIGSSDDKELERPKKAAKKTEVRWLERRPWLPCLS